MSLDFSKRGEFGLDRRFEIRFEILGIRMRQGKRRRLYNRELRHTRPPCQRHALVDARPCELSTRNSSTMMQRLRRRNSKINRPKIFPGGFQTEHATSAAYTTQAVHP